MKKAIHVGVDATTWWNDRGFGRFTRELLKALCARDSEFRYTLVVDRPSDGSLPANAEVLVGRTARTVTESAVGDSSRSLGDMWSLAKAVRAAHFDVFFYPAVYSYYPLPVLVPTVVAFHDTIAERFPKLVFPTRKNHLFWQTKVALAKLAARRAMTVSQASAKDLHEVLGIPLDRIDVITEAADAVFRVIDDPARVALAREKRAIPADAPLFVYVGGLNPHKNLLSLLRAFPAVLEQTPNAHLAIVGDTSGKGFYDNVAELQQFVADHPELKKLVHFTGYLSDEDLVSLFNAAWALVTPSLWEGFGLPAVEAMACGLPVIASARASLPEVIGDAGLFFDPESPSDIARALRTFLADPALRTRLRTNASARARTFTWDRGAELAEACFRNAVKQ